MGSLLINFLTCLLLLLCMTILFSAEAYRYKSNQETSENAESDNKNNYPKKDIGYEPEKDTYIFPNSAFMDSEKKYFVQWEINETHIILEVQVRTLGWIGLGFSLNPGMPNADMAIMWIQDGELTLEDRFAKGFYEPLKDEINNLTPIYGYENDTHTVVRFSRPIDTCDSEMDRKILTQATYTLYAYHSQDPPNGKLMKHEHRGSKRLFLSDTAPDFEEPPHSKKLLFRAKNYKIPAERQTTYRCFVDDIKDIDKKYQLIAINQIIDKVEVVHHMVLHVCDRSFKNKKHKKDFMCYGADTVVIMAQCFTTILGVWGAGGEGYNYPKDVGYPITPAMNGQIVILEVHYNNYKFEKDIVDTSGFILYFTDQLRKYDSNILGVAVVDFNWGLMIPPKQKEFHLFAVCSSSCTNNIEVPDEGINLFSYFLHTHLLGRKMKISIIRNGKELDSRIVEDNYSFDYQLTRNLDKPINIKKNDSILVDCTYSSEDKENYTFGGLATNNEMCGAVFNYYPRTAFTVCTSLTDYKNLIKKFNLKNTKIENTSAADLMTFNLREKDNSVIETVSDQVNTPEGRSRKHIEKLQKYYESEAMFSICRYMSLPSLSRETMPKYEPYSEPPSECK